MEEDYNEFILLSYKKSIEETLVQRAVKTITQIVYDKGLFDNYNNADEELKDFLFTKRPPDLEKVNDNIRGFCS